MSQSAASQIVLVTGTNSGFGRLITLTLARKGHTVFATMRDLDGRNASAAAELRGVAEAEGLRIHPLDMDPSSDASVQAAVAEAAKLAGPVDVLVNNAGMGFMGLEETLTPEQLTEQLNINVVAPHRLARAVLPSMRERGKGLLIHVSSGLGRIVFPAMGAYCASKAALESLFDAYRLELAPIGIDSVIVQPGAYPTDMGSRMRMGSDAERGVGYGPMANLVQQMGAAIQSMTSGPMAGNPQDIADAVLTIVETPAGSRPDRVVVDKITGQGTEALNAAHRQVQEQVAKMMSGGGGH